VQELAAAEGQELADQDLGPLAGLADLGEVGRIGPPGGQVLDQQGGVAVDDLQQVVEVVGDAAGELADGLELARLQRLGRAAACDR
jgi:hypothetical protein